MLLIASCGMLSFLLASSKKYPGNGGSMKSNGVHEIHN
jgi:hypothetical protein